MEDTNEEIGTHEEYDEMIDNKLSNDEDVSMHGITDGMVEEMDKIIGGPTIKERIEEIKSQTENLKEMIESPLRGKEWFEKFNPQPFSHQAEEDLEKVEMKEAEDLLKTDH